MSIIELKVPVIGESVTEVTLSSWLKENGSYVEQDESICEFESDKATIEAPAEKAGTLIWVASEGDDIPIGGIYAKIDTSGTKGNAPAKVEATPVKTETPAAEVKETADEFSYAYGHPSPAAKKLMDENSINPSDVKGSGKDGRVTKEDVLKAIEAKKTQQPAPAKEEKTVVKTAEVKATVSSGVKTFSRNKREEKMSRMRRTIATRLVSAKNDTAMLTTFNEIDMTGLMELRKKYQDDFVKKYGVKLGFMSLFAKACAKTLLEMPEVNAMLTEDEKSVIYHDYADISFAISTPTGLVVPPIQNVESLNFAEIELKLKGLAEKARNGSLTLEEMSGGTFTITNGGVFGSMMSTPIINPPQSAILGMHAIIERPIAVDGQVQIRPMMYVALSYDHRVIDGSSSVSFLVKVKQLLEDPTRLLMDL
jgi:2-oxoglutarate dehydrogenase E2 component (dihydrolipoamide succinyltransferase)